uniref:Uncharacterized protein n=1 Tax=Craspedostauros australis TaxID=1486917 RepID=A0A7R9WXL6_9STRA|mmetsp:Transcript_23635/g.66028  ORF Transcript_23635/g.66028 Transcript_23635/m.66028 type:complete len:247 (+) Transcript_23635:190-930(+)
MHVRIPCTGLIITESSWISLLPDTALEVRAMLEAHNQRIISNDQYNPQSAFLPVRDDDDLRDATTRKPSEQQQENVAQGESVEAPPAAAVAASTDPRPTIPAGGNAGATVTATTTPPTESSTATTLAELKTLPLPANFVGEVGIVNTFPPIDDGAEHLCRRSGDDFEYSFGVWLADATAVLNVLVVGSRGESLFGMSASDVMKNPRSAGRNIVGDSSMWRASIQAVKSKGKEFFVLRSISRRTEDV